MDTNRFHAQEGRLEQGLRTTETLITDGDDLTVGKLVGFLQGGGSGSDGHLTLEVEGDIAKFLLDVTNNFSFSGGGEGIATLSHNLHEVSGQVAASQVETKNGVRKSITFVDGNSVSHTVTSVQDDTSGTTGGVQGQHGLDGDVHGRGGECFEHDLGHLLTVGLGVEGSLC